LSERMKIMHVIGGLGAGGAEWMLCRLLQATDRERFRPSVLSLTGEGVVASGIREAGVPVRSLDLPRANPHPGGFARLVAEIRRAEPDVVQTWMYHSDLFGGLAARLVGRVPVAWGVHHTTHDPATTPRRTRAIVRACALVSRWIPRRIVCCSEATRLTHERLGYAADRMVVIPNGFDTQAFGPARADRVGLRSELGLPDGARLIGVLARYHPQKDHRTLIEAAALLPSHAGDVHFVLCGDGIDAGNHELREMIDLKGLSGRFHLMGRRDDTARILASLDVVTSSSSHGEAFPLVIGEAMASGTPAVVTDVGDSALIVGDTGRVVPPRDPAALSRGWAELLSFDGVKREELARAARERIEKNFEIHRIAERYAEVHRAITGSR